MIRDQGTLDALLAEVQTGCATWRIRPRSASRELDEVPRRRSSRTWRARGFFGWSIPEEYGGLGLTTEELVLGAMELSQCAVAFRARVGTNTGIGSEALVADGTDDAEGAVPAALAQRRGDRLPRADRAECGLGRHNIETTARRDGDHYVLNGTKCYITNAPIADLFTVFARTDPDEPGARGVIAFIVERGTPGPVDQRALPDDGPARARRWARSCSTTAACPPSNLIGGIEGTGFRTAMKVLNKQRIHLAALCTGPAIRMLDLAIAHAQQRRQFGQPIVDFQLVARA